MKVFKILASLALAFNLYAADKDHTIVVAVSPVPHAEIMEFIKPVLAKRGLRSGHQRDKRLFDTEFSDARRRFGREFLSALAVSKKPQ